jgi:glycosyltransferase involved in cell wall biosynthesis
MRFRTNPPLAIRRHRTPRNMKILQLSHSERAGGAEKVAYDLFQAYREHGHYSYMAVGHKKTEEEGIFIIPNDAYRHPWTRAMRNYQKAFLANKQSAAAKLSGWLANLGEITRRYERWQGMEDFHYPASRHLVELIQRRPDIIHAHNLHGGYFDLRALPNLSKIAPVILTLHDEWAFTGHCAYTFGCDRLELGCGECPHLETFPAIERDATAYNLKRKHEIYSRSQFYLAAPSSWLLHKAVRSILHPGIIEARLIPNGVDLAVFRPKNKIVARNELGLSLDSNVVLFVGNRTRSNPFKDYTAMEEAVKRVATQSNGQKITFLCIGEKGEDRHIGSATFRFIEFQIDPVKLASYYQAADVYLHAAKADNAPLVIIEAQACGVPVVATAVGGIPELIENGNTGFLVPQGDSNAMAIRTLEILSNDRLRECMSENAAEMARRCYNLQQQVESYLNWYIEILARNDGKTG